MEVDGDPVTFAINGGFVQDAINVMHSESVLFSCVNATSPIMITELDGDRDNKHVIMPMEIQGSGLDFPE
jgi:DNA polymerase III sliding clamp (beta) subunit (PCNA family)